MRLQPRPLGTEACAAHEH